MPQDSDCGHADRLRAELKAIELWDKAYWLRLKHEWWETVALESRRRRRIVILRELGMTDNGVMEAVRMSGFRNRDSKS